MTQSGPEHLQEAVRDLYAVRHFLEAPSELTTKDWQDAYDGLAHVVLAAERLATTLAVRCPGSDRAAQLAAVHELLQKATGVLDPSDRLRG